MTKTGRIVFFLFLIAFDLAAADLEPITVALKDALQRKSFIEAFNLAHAVQARASDGLTRRQNSSAKPTGINRDMEKFMALQRFGKEASVEDLLKACDELDQLIKDEKYTSTIDLALAISMRSYALHQASVPTPAQQLASLSDRLPSLSGYERLDTLSKMADIAVKAADWDKASLYANEVLKGDTKCYNCSPLVHHAHQALGHTALARHDTPTAVRELLASGEVATHAVLSSFGPSFTLADKLCDAGETQAVLDYLSLCRKFWTSGTERLDRWEASLKKGVKPDFSAFK